MQWLSDLCVILDGEQLLNASYHSYTAAPGQFSLDKPYQAKQQNSTATTSSDTRTVPPEFFPERALGLTSDTVPLVEPNHVVAWQNTARKRKRKPRLVDAQRIHRQQESDERHDSRQPILLAALKLLQQQTAQVHSHLLCNRPASEATPRQRDAEEGEADQHSSTETLDLCALHALKYTLHPKFHFADSTDPDPHEEPTVNLFDTLISNSHHQERSAAAYDAQVLIPAHATFLMSDVKRLQPLLSGTHTTNTQPS